MSINFAMAGHVDVGKCHYKGTPIMMYDGNIKLVEEIMDDMKNDDFAVFRESDYVEALAFVFEVTGDVETASQINQTMAVRSLFGCECM
jgi:hypothetical protein